MWRSVPGAGEEAYRLTSCAPCGSSGWESASLPGSSLGLCGSQLSYLCCACAWVEKIGPKRGAAVLGRVEKIGDNATAVVAEMGDERPRRYMPPPKERVRPLMW